MDARIECACCHRQERWSSEGDVPRVEVIVEGGSRRPPGNPGRARAETAIACVADPPCRVVGECPACGQLLVSRDPDVAPIAVAVDTPLGPLRVADGVIHGPDGPMDVVSARDLVHRAWAEEERQIRRDALMRAPLVAPVFVLVGAWVVALAFVWFFLGSVLQGPPGP